MTFRYLKAEDVKAFPVEFGRPKTWDEDKKVDKGKRKQTAEKAYHRTKPSWIWRDMGFLTDVEVETALGKNAVEGKWSKNSLLSVC